MKNRASLVSHGQQDEPRCQRPAPDVSAWEREIDERVHRLYQPAPTRLLRFSQHRQGLRKPTGLTPEKIKIVEEGVK